jgi:hypothetical protein
MNLGVRLTSEFEVFEGVEDDVTREGLSRIIHFLLEPNVKFPDVVHIF